MKLLLVSVLLLSTLTTTVAWAAEAGDVDELSAHLSLASFSWTEEQGGQRLLKESGPVFAGGGVAGLVVAAPERGPLLVVRGMGELWGGDVDYDGQTTGSDPNPPLPVHTNTVYFGVRGEGEFGARFPLAPSVSLEPFAGVGYRWWRRDISGGGVVEEWQSFYARAGLAAAYAMGGDMRAFLRTGALYPFHNRNSASTSLFGDVTVDPHGEWSAFAEAGVRYGRFQPSLFYEGWRFSKSPSVGVGTSSVFQPDSAEDVVGLRLGWAFH